LIPYGSIVLNKPYKCVFISVIATAVRLVSSSVPMLIEQFALLLIAILSSENNPRAPNIWGKSGTTEIERGGFRPSIQKETIR
jgi:hypothetical protein